MVNASLNWASIVGIVLAVGGAFLYFLRSFKPALARDYDVFFAAVGLLCGGILFFQGWRLDPILQFGQFLLAGTTVFFAYESVRLRGVTTEQARRSSFFDDDEPLPAPAGPYRPRMAGRDWDGAEPDRFDEPQALRRRIPARDPDEEADAFYRPRRASRAAIPERAASRRPPLERGSEPDRSAPGAWADESGFDDRDGLSPRRRYSAGGAASSASDFGSRRQERDAMPDARRGRRPAAASDAMPRSSRRGAAPASTPAPGTRGSTADSRPGIPQGTPLRSSRTAGAATPAGDAVRDADFSPVAAPTRDNSSRFDD